MSYTLKSLYEDWVSLNNSDDNHNDDCSIDDWFIGVESRVDQCVTDGTPVDSSDQFIVDNYDGNRSVR